MNNLDVGLELQKIRGGSLFNDINMHMNIKLDCRNKTTAGCKWINALKYYAYSAVSITSDAAIDLQALLTTSAATVRGGCSCFGFFYSKLSVVNILEPFADRILTMLFSTTLQSTPYFR